MKRLEEIINILLRAVFGGIGIYALNTIFQYAGIAAIVGINAKTIATVGILGLPGFFLLYGIMFYHGLRTY